MGTSIYSQSVRGTGNNMDLQLDPGGCWNLWLSSQSIRSTGNSQGLRLVSEVGVGVVF